MNNPNGANQYQVDPRQALFLENYLNPKSKTFANALQSALSAGYSQEYAENITNQMPKWLAESLGDQNRVRKAERVLDKTLEYEPVDEEGKIDTALLRTQTDVAKFVAERLGKKRYSSKQEVDHTSGGEPIKGFTYVHPDNQTNTQTTPDVGTTTE